MILKKESRIEKDCSIGWSKNGLSSQTEKLMAATTFSDFLGLKHYKKEKRSNISSI